jgi:hypothetical protein
MSSRRLGILLVVAICFLGLVVGVQRLSAGQVVLVPNGQDVRFQLIGNEPIAAPDGQSLVNGWSVLMFKDRKAGLCYLAFKQGNAIAATEAAPCTQ